MTGKPRDAASMTAVADRLSRRRGPLSARARLLYERAYALGDVTAAYNYAAALQSRGQFKQAVAWYRRAYRSGDSTALLPLARAELHGVGTRQNTAAAIAKLEAAVHSKQEFWPPYWFQCEAMLVLADLFLAGWPVRRDFRRGVEWLKRASRLGSEPARALLAYHTGRTGDSR